MAFAASTVFAGPAVAAEPTSDDPLFQRVDTILLEIQESRGVYASRPIARLAMTRDDLHAHLLSILDRDLPDSMRFAHDRLAVALGLVAPGESLLDRYLELLEDEIAGLYDNETETFYLLSDVPIEMQDSVIAHELFHALQDQEWGIDAILGGAEWVSDISLAARALLEGDAMAVMSGHLLGDLDSLTFGSPTRTVLSAATGLMWTSNPTDAPGYLWAQLVFPYAAGMEFVFAIVKPNDWSAVNAAYLDPPRSTEQVLHPKRYTSRDEPTWLTMSVDPAGADRYVTDVFGEFLIREYCKQLLRDVVSESACERAAAGWDGDRLEAFTFPDDEDRDLIVWLSVWDSVADATSFANVASRLTTPWLGVEAPSPVSGPHGQGWEAFGDQGMVWVEQWGDLALIVLDRNGTASRGTRVATVGDAVRDVWSSVSRSGYPVLTHGAPPSPLTVAPAELTGAP